MLLRSIFVSEEFKMKLDEKTKKIIYFSLFGLDIALTIFLFIISIIMIATMPKDRVELDAATGMIGYLQKNPNVFLGAVVVPLFLLLAINIYILIRYVKVQSATKKAELKDLSAEDKAKLKAQLMKELLSEENKEDKKE